MYHCASLLLIALACWGRFSLEMIGEGDECSDVDKFSSEDCCYCVLCVYLFPLRPLKRCVRVCVYVCVCVCLCVRVSASTNPSRQDRILQEQEQDAREQEFLEGVWSEFGVGDDVYDDEGGDGENEGEGEGEDLWHLFRLWYLLCLLCFWYLWYLLRFCMHLLYLWSCGCLLHVCVCWCACACARACLDVGDVHVRMRSHN